MARGPQVGAVGVTIRLTVTDENGVVDLSNVASKAIRFEKPDGVEVIKNSGSVVFTTDGLDGKIEYVTEAGFLDQEGVWRCQAQLTFPGGGGFNGPSSKGFFTVRPN